MTALLLLLALLGFLGLGTGDSSEAGEASASWDAICEPESTIEPCTSAEIGVAYPVALEGHCEIEVAYIDGRYWLTASGIPSQAAAWTWSRARSCCTLGRRLPSKETTAPR